MISITCDTCKTVGGNQAQADDWNGNAVELQDLLSRAGISPGFTHICGACVVNAAIAVESRLKLIIQQAP